jgi:hypothetical protein
MAVIRRAIIVVGCLLALGALLSCPQTSDCLVADSVKELKVISIGKADYYLYRKTSGFSDKASFYQLYEGKPLFDRCGKAASQPISDVYIDLTEGYPTRIVVENGKLERTYSKLGATPPDCDDVEIVVKQRLPLLAHPVGLQVAIWAVNRQCRRSNAWPPRPAMSWIPDCTCAQPTTWAARYTPNTFSQFHCPFGCVSRRAQPEQYESRGPGSRLCAPTATCGRRS